DTVGIKGEDVRVCVGVCTALPGTRGNGSPSFPSVRGNVGLEDTKVISVARATVVKAIRMSSSPWRKSKNERVICVVKWLFTRSIGPSRSTPGILHRVVLVNISEDINWSTPSHSSKDHRPTRSMVGG